MLLRREGRKIVLHVLSTHPLELKSSEAYSAESYEWDDVYRIERNSNKIILGEFTKKFISYEVHEAARNFYNLVLILIQKV